MSSVGRENRASQACEKLAFAGIQVVNVEGGTLAWDAAGLACGARVKKLCHSSGKYEFSSGAWC